MKESEFEERMETNIPVFSTSKQEKEAESAFYVGQIGDYQNTVVAQNEQGQTVYQQAAMEGGEDFSQALYSGIEAYQENYTRSTEKNAVFLEAISQELGLHRCNRSSFGYSYFRYLFVSYLEARMAMLSPAPEDHPSIAITDFLGQDGAKLLWWAMEEEAHDPAFRKHVFERSATFYAGPTWTHRLIATVVGPSGIGKSHNVRNIVQELQPHLACTLRGDGNWLVVHDGSLVRDASQIRNLLCQVVYYKGYRGLHRFFEEFDLNPKLGMRRCMKHVEQAVLTTKSVGLAYVETMSHPSSPKRWLKKLKALAGPESRMLAIRMGGTERSHGPTMFQCLASLGWMNAFGDSLQKSVVWRAEQRSRAFDIKQHQEFVQSQLPFLLGDRGPALESKQYNRLGYWFGNYGSSRFSEAFAKTFGKDAVVNVLVDVVIKTNKGEQWMDANPDDPGIVCLSQRLFAEWQNFRKTYLSDAEWVTHLRSNPSLRAATQEELQAARQDLDLYCKLQRCPRRVASPIVQHHLS